MTQTINYKPRCGLSLEMHKAHRMECCQEGRMCEAKGSFGGPLCHKPSLDGLRFCQQHDELVRKHWDK